jgi:Spy/CpxP family protein refolding chaperone
MDKSWRVILAFLGIFVAGTVTGGLIALRVAQKVADRRPPPPTLQQGPPQIGVQLLRRFAEQLNLSKAQRDKIRPIELRAGEELRRLRRETQQSNELIIDRLRDDIAAELTPEQRTRFEELHTKARDRFKQYLLDQERNRRDLAPPNRPRDGPPPPPK